MNTERCNVPQTCHPSLPICLQETGSPGTEEKDGSTLVHEHASTDGRPVL